MISHDDLLFFQALAASSSLAEAARKRNDTPPAVSLAAPAPRVCG
jgi:DNA-binding transcriptional LysR family regulator